MVKVKERGVVAAALRKREKMQRKLQPLRHPHTRGVWSGVAMPASHCEEIEIRSVGGIILHFLQTNLAGHVGAVAALGHDGGQARKVARHGGEARHRVGGIVVGGVQVLRCRICEQTTGVVRASSHTCTLTWVGLRPDCTAERVGEQYLKA